MAPRLSSAGCRPVLVVDEHEDTRALYRVCLEMAGFEVEVAGDAREALLKAALVHPAVVVTDLMLRGADPLQFVRELRAVDVAQPVPVIVVTGYTAASLSDRVRECGVRTVVVKPCSPERLRREVMDALQCT